MGNSLATRSRVQVSDVPINWPPPNKTKRVLFVLGAPCAGQEPFCQRLVKEFGLKYVHVEELVKQATEAQGSASPEALSKQLKVYVSSREGNRFIVEGFPRSMEDALAYEKEWNDTPDSLLLVDCPENVMEERMRASGETHSDVIRETIGAYREGIRPVYDYFVNKDHLNIQLVDGSKGADYMFTHGLPYLLSSSIVKAEQTEKLGYVPYKVIFRN